MTTPHGTRNWVPNAPLREAVELAVSNGDTLSAIAGRMGWTREHQGHTSGDTSRLGRSLGRLPHKDNKGGHTSYGRTTRYETAVKIVEALDLDPVEFNL